MSLNKVCLNDFAVTTVAFELYCILWTSIKFPLEADVLRMEYHSRRI